MERFFELFQEMKLRLGPVLIQLPPGLKFDRSLVINFLHIIKKNYSGYRFAVEVRHPSWITDDFFDLLAQHAIAFVIADSGKRFPYYEAVTTDFVYLRCHGPENLYASDYSDSQLYNFAEKIVCWLINDKDVWVFFNNDFHGFAVNNAVKLRDMVSSIIN